MVTGENSDIVIIKNIPFLQLSDLFIKGFWLFFVAIIYFVVQRVKLRKN